LRSLEGSELCASEVTEILGLAPSTVSKHLHLLAKAGLVTARQQGRWRYYRLARPLAGSCAGQALEWFRESVAADDGASDGTSGERASRESALPRKSPVGV